MIMFRCLWVLLISLLIHHSAIADTTVVLEADDWGWYSESGFHNPTSTNYIAGYDIGGEFTGEFRNFAVFDLSSINLQIVSASLILLNDSPDGYDSPDPTEDYLLYDVSSSISDLRLGNGGVAAFNDLGTGTAFGETTVSSADNEMSVSVELNFAAIAALNNSNSEFAIGGAVTTLSGAGVDEQIFARSNLNPNVTLLIKVIPVPEPGATSGVVLIGFVVASRRQRRGCTS